MKEIVTVDRMHKIEEASDEAGMSYLRLMENAGSAAAAFIRKRVDVRGRNCVIVAGKGNNGGDAFVVARKLLEHVGNLSVILADGLPNTGQSKEMLNRLLQLGAEVLPFGTDQKLAAQKLAEADLIIDGIFGTGFRGEIPQDLQPLFVQINHAVAAIFCLDVPSGVSARNGLAAKNAIQGDFTIAFHCIKAGMLYDPARKYLGETHVVSIGVPDDLGEEALADGILVEEEEVFSVLKKRPADSHKGYYGHLLNLCGSTRLPGAAVLSAMGAARVGVGLLTAASPAAVLPSLISRLPEAMTLPLQTDDDGLISLENSAEIEKVLKKTSACLIGCGIGRKDALSDLLEKILCCASCPVVIDADGINNLSGRIEMLHQAKGPVVLTPHMGEMARLLAISTDELRENRMEILKRFVKEFGVIVVLKDSVTTIFEPGGTFFVNQTGNAGLAKGGSGDLLAGMIAGFCAQSIPPIKSAVCAVYLHGRAADLCAARQSQYSMLPSDLLEDLAEIFVKHGL